MQLLKINFSFYFLICVSHSCGDDKFVKKYAMMKIYESCFGPDVLLQIQKEIKHAVLKCTSHETSRPSPPPLKPSPPPLKPSQSFDDVPTSYQQQNMNQLRPSFIAYRPNNPYPYAPNLYSGYPNQGAMLYQVPFQQSYGFPPNNLLFFGQQYYGNQRTARNMDAKNFTARMNSVIKNTTCVMQKLGYLDDNLEPNYSKIKERIRRMSIPQELRSDIEDGISFCQQFLKCVPEDNNKKSWSISYSQPMLFFKCYNNKKLEACVLKDVRDNRLNLDENELIESEMSLRSAGGSSRTSELDSLGTSIYEFLYGRSNNEDIGNFFKSE